MLTKLAIKNFKGIGERIELELAPITLLFGPNSAGKSSVLHAIQYAREVLERDNTDAGRISFTGNGLDVGGFASLVHGRDTTRAVSFRFDLDFETRALTELREGTGALEHEELTLQGGWAEIAVRSGSLGSLPFVERYEVGANGEHIATIDAHANGVRTEILANYDHPALAAIGPGATLRDDIFNAHGPTFAARERMACNTGRNSALPARLHRLEVPALYPDAEQEPEGTEACSFFEDWLSTALVGTAELLRQDLAVIRHIGPIREIPPRELATPRFPDETRWWPGLAAWDLLAKGNAALVKQTSDWLVRLKTGYELRVDEYKELPVGSRLASALRGGTVLDDVEDLQAELERLVSRHRIVLVDTNTRIEVLPSEVGVGVSQVLPVVVAALDPSPAAATRLVAIEQPELHIHPAIQVELADLFATQIREGRQRYLLETHSEHLMLRLLRRIEQTTEGDLPPGAPELRPDDVAVYYIDQVDGQVVAHRLRIDETGEFIDRWPKGFFEERAEELF